MAVTEMPPDPFSDDETSFLANVFVMEMLAGESRMLRDDAPTHSVNQAAASLTPEMILEALRRLWEPQPPYGV